MKYFIQDGVRRALASREDRRKTVPAVIIREGEKKVYRSHVDLNELYTSKRTVERDLRFLRIVSPIYEHIILEPLGVRGQPSAIPLSKVRLT